MENIFVCDIFTIIFYYLQMDWLFLFFGSLPVFSIFFPSFLLGVNGGVFFLRGAYEASCRCNFIKIFAGSLFVWCLQFAFFFNFVIWADAKYTERNLTCWNWLKSWSNRTHMAWMFRLTFLFIHSTWQFETIGKFHIWDSNALQIYFFLHKIAFFPLDEIKKKESGFEWSDLIWWCETWMKVIELKR